MDPSPGFSLVSLTGPPHPSHLFQPPQYQTPGLDQESNTKWSVLKIHMEVKLGRLDRLNLYI